MLKNIGLDANLIFNIGIVSFIAFLVFVSIVLFRRSFSPINTHGSRIGDFATTIAASFFAICAIGLTVFVFFSFGPGDPKTSQVTASSKDGMSKIIQRAKPEKSIAQLELDNKSARPKQLKRQDDTSASKEISQAKKELKEIFDSLKKIDEKADRDIKKINKNLDKIDKTSKSIRRSLLGDKQTPTSRPTSRPTSQPVKKGTQ